MFFLFFFFYFHMPETGPFRSLSLSLSLSVLLNHVSIRFLLVVQNLVSVSPGTETISYSIFL